MSRSNFIMTVIILAALIAVLIATGAGQQIVQALVTWFPFLGK